MERSEQDRVLKTEHRCPPLCEKIGMSELPVCRHIDACAKCMQAQKRFLRVQMMLGKPLLRTPTLPHHLVLCQHSTTIIVARTSHYCVILGEGGRGKERLLTLARYL